MIRVTEQPAFRSQSVTNKQLSLSWNEAARDFTLQRTTVFSGANWEDLSDSDKTNRVPWPLLNSNEFFRPQRQTPGVLPNLRSP